MIRIMLVDKEGYNRKKLSQIIVSAKLGFNMSKEAASGKEALDILEKNNIDLIISDIRLPDINGYQLFQLVKENYPRTKMILYSSYNEYEYVQKALEEGLIDYVFKPVKEQELKRSLIRAKRVFDELFKQYEEQSRILTKLDESLPVFQDRFLINLMHGHLDKEGEIQGTFEYFNIMIIPGYTVMVLKIDYYDKLSLIMEEKDKHVLIFSILYNVQSILEECKNGVAFINRHDEITVLLGNRLSIDQSIEIGENIRKIVETKQKITVTVGIGKMYSEARKINISYKQAKAAIRYNFYLGCNSVIHINYVEPNNKITYEYPLKKEELLVYETVIGNEKRAIELSKELYGALRNSQPLPEKLLPKIILDILVSINRYASEQGINMERFFARHFSMREIIKREDLDEGFSYFIDILTSICKHINKERKVKEEHIITKAQEYVSKHLAENISLNKVAARVQTTPENLSVLFAKKGHRSFYDYCTKLRIDYAKELMVKTDFDDNLIAVKIGYNDKNYYRKIFEQMERITPDDFRNQIAFKKES